MYHFLLHAHKGWRHLVMLIAVIVIVNAIIGVVRKSDVWTKRDKVLSLLYPIFIDIQVLMGILLYVVGGWWKSGMSAAIRFEHPTIMLIALALAHFGLRRVKSGESCGCKHKHALAWFLTSFLLILVGVIRIAAVKAGA